MVYYHQYNKAPALADTPAKNRAHVKYIACRAGVEQNPGANHGLFGQLAGMHGPDACNLRAAMQRVYAISQQGVVMQRAVIALKDEDAIEHGFTGRPAWEQLIKRRIADIAKINDIPLDRLEWIAAYHHKRSNPHCHIVFYDARPGVQPGYVAPELFEPRMEYIRGRIAQSVYYDEFKALFAVQEAAEKSAIDNALLTEFSQAVQSMNAKEYRRIRQRLAAISPDYVPCSTKGPISDPVAMRVAAEIWRIRAMIPSHGALKYAFMPQDMQYELRATARRIIDMDADCSSAMARYLDASAAIRAMYAGAESVAHAKTVAEQDLLKKVSNQILACVRVMLAAEAAQRTEQWKRQQVGDLITGIFYLLNTTARSQEARKQILRNELSKEARIELAKSMENKGIDWGQ